MCQIEILDPSLVQVGEEIVGPEGYVCTSKGCSVLKGLFSRLRHSTPVANRIRTPDGVCELELVVCRESRKIFHQDVVASSVRVGAGLKRAVRGCSAAKHTRIGVGRVVNPDDYTFPIVTVAANDITGGWLILGEIPSVHDGEPAPVPGRSGIELTLVLVSTSCTDITCILKASTINKNGQGSNI